MRTPLLALVLLPLWLSDSSAQRPQPAAQPRPVVRAVRAMVPEATRVKLAKVPGKAAAPQARAAERRAGALANALQARPPKAARRDTLTRRR
ncbi:MAG: hypothetical protein A2085_05070 [Gemmatimonadetes bacterium GWC2_71_10]|nr:MAG: hypothetical protein A2085_05070 [Gemmatimonadetes bacterium GWC2_71_10]